MDTDKVIDVENLASAHFECVYPTCGGACCQQGRPAIEPGEQRRIAANLAKFLPRLRPAARKLVEKSGFLTRRIKAGRPMLALVAGSCVFDNGGCVLHTAGAAEGDRFKYKPWRCAIFPLDRAADGTWFVRQWKHRSEAWNLFCLNPKESKVRASASCTGEVEFAKRLEANEESWRGDVRANARP